MTRTKTKPPMRKPLFDADEVISFAAAGDTGRAAGTAAEATRSPLTLMLLPEAVARLRAAADRKGKTIDQVVEKLVIKHLDKH
jgi:hypothetical protein